MPGDTGPSSLMASNNAALPLRWSKNEVGLLLGLLRGPTAPNPWPLLLLLLPLPLPSMPGPTYEALAEAPLLPTPLQPSKLLDVSKLLLGLVDAGLSPKPLLPKPPLSPCSCLAFAELSLARSSTIRTLSALESTKPLLTCAQQKDEEKKHSPPRERERERERGRRRAVRCLF
jgi:hypothetical protein